MCRKVYMIRRGFCLFNTVLEFFHSCDIIYSIIQYASEVLLMSSAFDSLTDNEIKELITNRLISNMLCKDFSYESYDNITNSIILTHDSCGNAVITSMRSIEDGKVSCPHCEVEKFVGYRISKLILQT